MDKTGFARFWLALERSILGPSRVQRGPIAALNWLRQYLVPAAGAKLCSRRGAQARGRRVWMYQGEFGFPGEYSWFKGQIGRARGRFLGVLR